MDYGSVNSTSVQRDSRTSSAQKTLGRVLGIMHETRLGDDGKKEKSETHQTLLFNKEDTFCVVKYITIIAREDTFLMQFSII